MTNTTKPQRSVRSIDETDRRILEILQANARVSNKDLATMVSLSQTPCLRRVALLEETGVIQGYKAKLDPAQVGFPIRAFLTIKRSRDSDREAFWRGIVEIREVVACHVISGEFDLLVEVFARSIEDLMDLITETISLVTGVYDVRSMFSMKVLKTMGDMPIETQEID